MRKILFLTILFFGLVSCNSTRRAEKRIYNIVENHQELVLKDTVKIDTVFTVPGVQDSVIFALDTIVENQTHTIRTERGEFGITILPTREIKVEYFPESVDIHFRSKTVYDKIVIHEPPQKWRDVLFACIIGFVGLLFLKLYFERIMK